MNSKQVRGVLRGFAGLVEEHAGKLIGNRQMQTRGIAKSMSARAERIVGEAAETIKAILRRHRVMPTAKSDGARVSYLKF